MVNLGSRLVYLLDVALVWLVQVQSRHLVKRCESDIDITSYKGCVKTEAIEGSRVQFDALDGEFTDGSKLQVEFKTSHTSGLIFYATRRHDDESIIAIHINRGYLRYTFRCRYGSAELTYSKKKVNDNKWHKVVFRLEARTGIVYIDNRRAFRDYYLSCPGFTTIVFGGVKPSHFGSSSVRSLRRAQLDGGLRRTEISTGWTSGPRYFAVSSCRRD